MQKKDVIYIDVEDDITAIIGKVKDAKEKIVALVPPKRTGVLQSAVNLRLLARTADNAGKRLVLITGSSALGSLAASAKIPVAKTLQSPPRLADLPGETSDDEDDVIEGDKLPVGDHAGLKNHEEEEIIVPADLESLDMESDAKPKKSSADAKKKPRIKVPDFGSFRKKMAFGIVAGILLILFLVWANVIAPHATVIVSAKTSPVDINTPINLGDSLSTDPDKNNLATTTQTDKQTQDISFDATGSKEIGDKASGTVVFNNCQDNNSLTVQAGTYISNGNSNYIVQSTVVVPGGSGNFITGCTSAGQSAPVKVVAEDIGDSYNTSAGAQFTVAGFSSQMTATSSDGISGGNSHQATVVTADDVKKALDQLKQQNTDDEKKTLTGKFDSGFIVIDSSFTADSGEPKLTPGIGEEVTSGQAKLSVDVTYSIMGVAKSGLDDYLNKAITQQLGGDNSKRIYDSGMSSAQFTAFQASSSNNKPATATLQATGQVGIKLDDSKIKDEVEGKRSGEVIDSLKKVDGIDDVSVNLSPFWVGSVPGDPNKITIQFKLLSNG